MTITETTGRTAPDPGGDGVLRGRIALVTGAASGLGAATARLLAASGMRVVVADLAEPAARTVTDGIAAFGGDARPVALDVSDEGSAAAAVAATVNAFGGLDVLVNNAGTDVTKPLEEMTPDELERVLRVNLHGPALMTRAALPALRASRAPHVVNIASTAAKRAWPEASAYHASKWGLLGLSHALHAELRPAGIKVTAIVAGGMRTPFILERFPDVDPGVLQDPVNVAATIRFVISLPAETVIPELMVLPMRETSWP
ncbi:MAG TPA: SDR family oxidoreductase [Candidatus Limnocylindrales bacterium]|jgi:NAD(P)-dependent dehydrogenase (short-subunit alcohol dehydrogenase family)|nr:SDR family oxidoreductase [Candidatus Limnocylindrales bacterium]